MMVPSGVALVMLSALLEAYKSPSESVGALAFIGIVLIIAGVVREFSE